ncbi:hypothetical protein AC1031_013388 [Aphanomyces cochlioides]|nr:hypothetical protein AC1031_013388 [Aphanomyces cochlioides]
MTAVVHEVVRSRELMDVVFTFQQGHYHDMLPFLKLTPPMRHTLLYGLRTYTLWIDLDTPHRELESWYAEYGTTRVAKLLQCIPTLYSTVLYDASAFGNVAVLDRLKQVSTIPDEELVYIVAAVHGQIEVLQALQMISKVSTETMDWAASYGQLQVVEWLHSNRLEGCTVQAMNFAACQGHLPVVQWLHEHRSEGCTSLAIDLAATNGHLDIVQWLHQNRTEGCTQEAMNSAAQEGRLEVVKWLFENRTEGCTPHAIRYAAENGHGEVVRFLHRHQLGDVYWGLNEAVKNHRFDLARELVEDIDGNISALVDRASSLGHIDLFKYLRKLQHGHVEKTEQSNDERHND